MELLFLALLLVPVFGQSTTTIFTDVPQNVGITPDNPFYFLDVAIDQIRYGMANTESERAKIGLEIAEERLVEVKAMINENKISDADKAQKEHDSIVKKVEEVLTQPAKSSSEQDVEKELEDTVEIEKRLEDHKSNVDEVKEKVKERLLSNLERLSSNDHANLEKITNGLTNAIENIDKKVSEEKERIKTKLTDDFDTPRSEVNAKVATLEHDFGEKVKLEKGND